MDTKNENMDIIQVNLYRDGGTSTWISVEDWKNSKPKSTKKYWTFVDTLPKCNKYYLDNRIGSITKGELFDRYPSDEGAQILDKSKFNFVTEEQLKRDSKIDEITKL